MTTQHFILYTSAPFSTKVMTRKEIHEELDGLIGQDTMQHLQEEGESEDLTLLAEIASNEYQVFKVYDQESATKVSSPVSVQHLARRLGWV